MDEIKERITRLEEKVSNQEGRIKNVEQTGTALTRLTTLVEMQMEVNKDQQVQLKEFSSTLIKVNSNLDKLNSNQEDQDKRITGIENILNGQNVNVVGLVKSILSYVLTGAGGLILGYLAIKFGLK